MKILREDSSNSFPNTTEEITDALEE